MSGDNINIRHRDRLFIGGQWVAATAGGRIQLVDPATEETFTWVAEAGEADMDRAVVAARQAFDDGPWPRMSHAERGTLVAALAKKLEVRHAELAAAWTRQMGGLASFAPNVTMGGTFQLGYFAGLASTYPFETQQPASMGPGRAIIVREPVGVVAAITPWNAPYAIMAQKIAPALIAGCTVIMKPAPETPLEAYIIAECAEEVGLPPGVLNLVPAQREAADHLVRNPGVDKVAFTGSTAAGRRIASVCGERIARVTLELGGKSAALVLDDFPIEQAAGILTGTICTMTGQVCATLSRVIVSRHRYAQLAAAIVAAMAGIKVGDPHDPASQMGPLAMRRQLERVKGYIAKGKEQGATLACGGRQPAHPAKGYYFEPTLFTGVDNRMAIAQEEIFGPVISLIACADEDDAIRIANDSIYGLNGAVFTADPKKAYDVARRLRTGCIGQSGLRMDFMAPYGGFKQSGIGREGGPENFQAFTETKTILID
ncbi:MAG TPA: aldehyde dehydrogenase [Steroidobacteraceae bacterium]|nr:aldehyde dehydrogenase [Steroidobacteraceae bacterium]